jgi:hypothetical protein
MQKSGVPTKFPIPWASAATAPYIRTIPQASQINIQAGAASLTDGYPPVTFLQAGAGGVSPFGSDTNGILNQITLWCQWMSAGGPIVWDSAFSAAVGGYPLGAIVQSATTAGLFWYCQADNNTSNPDTGGSNWLGFQLAQTIPAGQVRFTQTTGTTCTLTPINGGLLWINGLNYLMTGGTFTNTGLSPNTLYYAYVQVNASGVFVYNFSTTGYNRGSNGVAVKIGDATQTLVGMVQTNSSSQFVLTDGSYWVRTWYQRQLGRSRTQFSAPRTTSSTIATEINNEIRNSFLVWANENIQFSVTGSFYSGAGGGNAGTYVSFDSGAIEPEAAGNFYPQPGVGVSTPIGIIGVKTGLTEGLHYATLFGSCSAGTAGWVGTNASSQALTMLELSFEGQSP